MKPDYALQKAFDDFNASAQKTADRVKERIKKLREERKSLNEIKPSGFSAAKKVLDMMQRIES